GTVTMCAPEVAANAAGPCRFGATSRSPARHASASLVSSEKNLNEMRANGTLPPHQCGLATYSSPLVGSKLVIFQGPVPIVRTPGCPIVPLCASANDFSKMPILAGACVCQLASRRRNVTTTVYLLAARMLLTLGKYDAAIEPG